MSNRTYLIITWAIRVLSYLAFAFPLAVGVYLLNGDVNQLTDDQAYLYGILGAAGVASCVFLDHLSYRVEDLID